MDAAAIAAVVAVAAMEALLPKQNPDAAPLQPAMAADVPARLLLLIPADTPPLRTRAMDAIIQLLQIPAADVLLNAAKL